MLADVANFINESPYVVILGFVSSIVGLLEMVVSSIQSIRIKKHKGDKADIKQKNHEQNSFAVSKDKLENEKDADKQKNDVEIELSSTYEEDNFNRKENSEDCDAERTSHSIFIKITRFITSNNARDLIFMLLFGEAIVYFSGMIFGEILAQLLAVACIWIFLQYINEKYVILKSERGRTIINCYINVGIALYFFDVLFNQNGKQLLIWAFMIFTFFSIRKKTSIVLDVVGPFLALPFLISLFAFPKYETQLLFAMITVQSILVMVNIMVITKETKLLLKQGK